MDDFCYFVFVYLVSMLMGIIAFEITERVERLKNHRVLWFLLNLVLGMELILVFHIFMNAYNLLLFLAE